MNNCDHSITEVVTNNPQGAAIICHFCEDAPATKVMPQSNDAGKTIAWEACCEACSHTWWDGADWNGRHLEFTIPESRIIPPPTSTTGNDNIQKFMALLSTADAVTIDDGTLLTNWTTAAVNDEFDNQIAHFSWVDDEGLIFADCLTEEGVGNAVFHSNGKCVLKNAEGETTVVRFFAVTALNDIDVSLQSGDAPLVDIANLPDIPWEVEICRTSHGFNDIEVIAKTMDEAIAIAENRAGDLSYSEKSSEYSFQATPV